MYIEKENEVCPQMNTERHRCPQGGRGWGTAIASNYHKNILVEER